MRLLKASEVEVRVGMCKEKGASLLLYKNARVDMQIMDENFGAMNWKREHKVVNGNNYCSVSVYNEKINEWVSKEDCGTESMTEKQKGEASDSFKRACVNWGIGRELYTSPFIWITNIKTTASGQKWKTHDKFRVKEITYNDDREIANLIIINQDNKEVFSSNSSKNKKKTSETKEPEKKKYALSDKQIKRLYTIAKIANKSDAVIKKWIKEKWNKDSAKDLTRLEYDQICAALEKKINKAAET